MYKFIKYKRLIYILSLPLALFLFILLSNILVHFSSASHIYENIEEAEVVETAIVLGAAIYSDGDLSPIYKDRVDTAFELYQAGKVSKILASGDNSTVEHNEVNPVRNYLLARGIPDADIYLDHAGFDTYSTMYRARDIFEVSSVIIVTQSFHLPRAVFIARALGIDAYGVPADDGSLKISNYIREIFANEKAILNIVLQRKPKYLGDTIPIGEEREVPTPEPAPQPVEEVDLPEHSPYEGEFEGRGSGECFVGGCSGQVCSDDPGVITTCEYREEYACYQSATCERQASGECGWTETAELRACLEQ